MYRQGCVRFVIYGVILTTIVLIGVTCALDFLGNNGTIEMRRLKYHTDFHTFLGRFHVPQTNGNLRFTSLGEKLEKWERDTSQEYVMQLADKRSRQEAPSVRHYDFEISKVNSLIAGKHRKLLAINGQYPGPLIEAIEGDTIVIHVVNRDYDSPTVLHFHGLSMNGSEYLDGVVGLTQRGISPGESFTYEFKVKQSGTHWYHSHFETQRVQGLLGPLVVHSRLVEDDFNDETIEETAVVLTDLYDKDPQDLMLSFKEPWIGGDEPIPDLTLIQGKELPVIQLSSSPKHKLRLINACSYTTLRITLDQHDMTIVAADGTPTQPLHQSVLVIYPGQRYDIIVNHSNKDLSSYWLRAEVCKDVWELSQDKKKAQKIFNDSKAVILYQNTMTSAEPQNFFPNSQLSVHKTDGDVEKWLVPLLPVMPPEPDLQLNLSAKMGRDEDGEIEAGFNGTSFFLHNYYRIPRLMALQESWPRILTSEEITVVDIVLRNEDDGPHPFHLHGGKFWVLDRGINTGVGSYWSSLLPLQRDTVWLPKNEWVHLRFVADNPGLWLFHCHIPWHSQIGMQGVFAVMPSRITLPTQT